MHSRGALKSNHDKGVEEKRERSSAAVGNGNVDDSAAAEESSAPADSVQLPYPSPASPGF